MVNIVDIGSIKDSFEEPYLPLHFFMHEIFVFCPSCNNKACIRCDIPPVSQQKPVNYVFNDSGTFSFNSDYQWSQAKFSCSSCMKQFEYEQGHRHWKGKVLGKACVKCAICYENGYKTLLTDEKEHEKYHSKLPKSVSLQCQKCNQVSNAEYQYIESSHLEDGFDPIFGLPLWFKETVKGNLLWGFNKEHLEILKQYLSAQHRKTLYTIGSAWKMDKAYEIRKEQGDSFSKTLPKWIKSKKNKVEIISKIERLLEK